MRTMLIAAATGLAVAAVALFATTSSDATPAPTQHVQTAMGNGGSCC
ncbi:hypothetical protein [Kitasatospora sp. NPDC058190]